MECCNNCRFYQDGKCTINHIDIDLPEIAICDDWTLSENHRIVEYDDLYRQMYEFFEMETDDE